MTRIRVNHKTIDSTMIQTRKCIEKLQQKTESADKLLSDFSLNHTWEGKDKDRFMDKWKSLSAEDSSYAKELKALSRYADYLQKAADMYIDVQSELINMARGHSRIN